ncbi:MAG: nucleotide exchange factor GrpE [Terriglobia bacterium]
MQKSRKPVTHSPSQSVSALKKTHTDQLEELRAALHEKEVLCAKTLAEFDNYRKRTAKDGNAEAKAVIRELLLELVAVQDSFDRAFQSEALKAEPQVYQGMRSIQRQIHQLLEQRGVLTFDCAGQPFNPTLHEAVDTEPSHKYPDATVSREIEKGYLWEGKVLRPAKVVVARALPSFRVDERV